MYSMLDIEVGGGVKGEGGLKQKSDGEKRKNPETRYMCGTQSQNEISYIFSFTENPWAVAGGGWGTRFCKIAIMSAYPIFSYISAANK